MGYVIHNHAKDVKTFENQQSARYGHSTVTHEPIVVMAHHILTHQRYQKRASPLVAKISLPV